MIGRVPLGAGSGYGAARRHGALPLGVRALRNDVKIPWGDVGLVNSISNGIFGMDAPPKLGLWPRSGEATLLSYIREVPTFSLLRPNPITVREAERVRYAGAQIPALMPVVRLGAELHVGKGTVLGSGCYRIVG